MSGMQAKIIKVAGIVLAAGSSSRMGRPKQLLPFRGRTLLDQVISHALKSDLDPIVVVLGHGADTIRKQVALAGVCVVENEDYAVGQSSSLKKGLTSVEHRCDGAMFLLGDQPLVDHGVINTLIRAFQAALPPIVIPFCNGKRGNPVIIHHHIFPLIYSLSGDAGARKLFARYQEGLLAVETGNDGILFDVDTLDDFQKLQSLAVKS
ncbi:molybdenum cofactor cytidylyltransferase [Desulfocicer niacini]